MEVSSDNVRYFGLPFGRAIQIHITERPMPLEKMLDAEAIAEIFPI